LSATPLAGVRVVDLSRHLPGPLAAHLLADLGARVVKVEEPLAGDPLRSTSPRRQGHGPLAALLLSGVESVALDLKQPAGRAVVERLLVEADVLLETFRPGTLARLGFDPAGLRARHPRLVVCSLSGWGQEGPDAGRAGHDLSYQAAAGTLAPTAPEPVVPAVPVADLVGAWGAVGAILAALVERQRTGAGCLVDAALFDAAAHANLIAWAAEASHPRQVGEALPLSGALPCYGVYRTADGGFLALALLEPHFWRRFCVAAGRPELVRRQYSPSPRARRRVAALVASRPRAEWAALLAREDLPGGPVLSAAEVRRHPQMRARAVLAEGPDGLPRLRYPARFDGHRPAAGLRLPAVGEQTADVLRELGMDSAPGIGRPTFWQRLMARLRRLGPGDHHQRQVVP